ncbi:hypothetical protein WAI91_22275 [Acinetobacter baumannii]
MRRYASYPTYSSVHLVGLISRVSGASGIGCRIQPTGVFISPDHGQTGRRASLRTGSS